MEERLQKILSAYGLASRRAAEQMIADGRVRVNGAVARLGMKADPLRDQIEVDGNPLSQPGARVYILLNKPRGYVTTVRDERGRKTVMELVRDCGARVYPVGRLDMDSEGLLLLTNDGALANRLTHPAFHVEKTYHVLVQGQDAAGQTARLGAPMQIDGVCVQAKHVALLRGGMQRALYAVTIGEGRNRQVRRMCAACGLEVLRLRRVAQGPLRLDGLRPGAWRPLTAQELLALQRV